MKASIKPLKEPVIVTFLRPLKDGESVKQPGSKTWAVGNKTHNKYWAIVEGKKTIVCVDQFQCGANGEPELFAQMLYWFLSNRGKPIRLVRHTIPKLDEDGNLITRLAPLMT